MIRRSALIAAAIAVGLIATGATAQRAERSCSYLETPDGRIHYDPFVIFFDTGSAAITVRSSRILENVAAAYRPLSHCRMEVTAHADRVGSTAYNLALSKRRANAILAYLRRLGVRAEARIEYFGESRPLVETDDGIAEPENRRAEIVIAPREGS